MKQETNNESDLLLRRLSRRHDGAVREDEQHLDVDELSSYAQNALPAAARARYTQHLADCSTCRKLVTELSLSTGSTAAVSAPVGTVAGAGWLKKFLASLFSPMVLRYAVPALGVLVVAVVGFVVLRQPQDRMMAKLEPIQSAPLTEAQKPAPPAESPAAGFVDKQSGRPSETAEPKQAEPPKAEPTSGIIAGNPAGAGAPIAAPVTVEREENAAGAPKPQPSIAVSADAPPPAAKADVADTTERKKDAEDQKKNATIAKSQPAAQPGTQVATAQANEPSRDSAAEKERGRADESKREALPVQRRGAFGRVSPLGSASAEKDKSETRSVAGRRFRKERGIWTDTAYDSDTATVNMARDSEQFKALVADEPEIKKIAEQLDGEVIVVWKGRAYRIR
jgi:hypothetical protein